MRQAVEEMKNAFVQLSSGAAIVPLRTNMTVPQVEGRVLVMPVAMPACKMFAVKVVSIFRENPRQGLPTIHGLLMLSDASTGSPLAMMDAEYMTALRTGAASGLATSLLARPDAEVVAIIGAGAQARTQLEGVCAVRNIRRAVVVDPNPDKARLFAGEMSARLHVPTAVTTASAAVADADIICTATTSTRHVFDDCDIKKGVHINAVGAYRPDMCEVPAETIRRAKVVVDLRSAGLAEAGDILQPIRLGIISESHIHAELGEIVAGSRAGRNSGDEITIFKSVGNAVQDLAVASFVMNIASKREIGTVITL